MKEVGKPSVPEEQEPVYSIRQTEDRGRAVFASQHIPEGTTVLVVKTPIVSVIKKEFEKEVCAWCYRYQHGKTCKVKYPGANTGLRFCTEICLDHWKTADYDGKLAESLASLCTDKAKNHTSKIENFPLECARLVASAIVARKRTEILQIQTPSWKDVLNLQAKVFYDDLDLSLGVSQITSFLEQNLPIDLQSLVQSTAFPFLSRHLPNSFGIWELPVTPDSENLGSLMYPAASYFNHSCEPNVVKTRDGRVMRFVTLRSVDKGAELCISYGHIEKDVQERRETLRDIWGFECNCPRCIWEIEQQIHAID